MSSPSCNGNLKRKVLVVDDEPIVRTMVRLFLARVGFEVFEAECGIKALAVIKANRLEDLELLLTDIHMPNMDGIALAERCKRYYPRVKVVFMSGYSALPSLPADSPLQPFHFVCKPFKPEDLVTALLRALEEGPDPGGVD